MAMPPVQSGSPGLLRSLNDRAALSLLISQGPMTRVQLSEATGLSGPTASQVVNRLSAAGLVCQAGHTTGSRGPNAVVYRACAEAARGVAVHIRAGRITARVVDAAGQPYPTAEVRLAAKGHSARRDLTDAITAACAAAGQNPDDMVAVCVGVPASVSTVSDDLHFVEALPGWPRHAVRAQIEEQLGRSVIIENDANLAAVAEADERADDSDFALLWQGEGVSVAAVTDGRVRRGVAGGAGEIGYLPVPRDADGFDQTATDLQGLAGGGALTRLARAHRSSIRTYDAALQALREGELRSALLADLAPRTAQAIIPVIAVLDPAGIVLGGPTGATAGAEGAGLVQAYLRRNTRWRTPVSATKMPLNPVLRGAALTLSGYLAESLLDRVV